MVQWIGWGTPYLSLSASLCRAPPPAPWMQKGTELSKKKRGKQKAREQLQHSNLL